VPWVWIHQTPDYAYFNHAMHVNRGISCVECHGKVNEMDTVQHTQPLSMSFCLDCHRDPELPFVIRRMCSTSIPRGSPTKAKPASRPPRPCTTGNFCLRRAAPAAIDETPILNIPLRRLTKR
jgi:hypothetical protein